MPYPPPLTSAEAANDVWCADFKGQFRLRSGAYCYPLTISDRYSRFVVACEGLESTQGESAMLVFEAAFRRFGLPYVIRTDNGTPFASRGVFGLSRLAVRWLRLGIRPERIERAHPEQNGQHERMHRVLKAETTRPAAVGLLQQQERFDRFVDEYNHERPHEALGQVPPASLYQPSSRAWASPADPDYPFHDDRRRVSRSGHLSLAGRGRNIFVCQALAGELVGLRQLDDHLWLLSFMDLDLGIVDVSARRFSPMEHSPLAAPPEPTDTDESAA